MATLAKAIEIAAAAHGDTRDKVGRPYILHPVRVMMGVQSDEAKMVAILHDVVEDTERTLDDMRAAGFSGVIIEALSLVTHDKENTGYADYVVACKKNSIAREVKLSDLRDNSSLSRLLMRPEQLEGDTKRMMRYVLAYRYLLDELDETEYRQLSQPFESQD